MTITRLSAGCCRALHWFMNRTAPFAATSVPVGIALIDHPDAGLILYDTGLSPRCLATDHWSQRPVHRLIQFDTRPDTTAAALLARRGVSPSAVRYVIISHFHNDHLGGLLDFPGARLVGSHAEYARLMRLSRVQQAHSAFNPALLPADFEQRLIDIGELPMVSRPELPAFADVREAFSAVYLVGLPGHARGQYGAFLPAADPAVFLLADAVWTSHALTDPAAVPPAIVRLVLDNWADYQRTVHKLRRVRLEQPFLQMLASHDPLAFGLTENR